MTTRNSICNGIGVIALTLGVQMAAEAVPVFSIGAVVGAPTNSATFDSLSVGDSLSGYQEDGIAVDVQNTSWQGFSPFSPGDPRTSSFFYGNGGDNHWVTVSLVGGGTIGALDLLLGDGWSGPTTNLIWETFNGATSTGFGDVVVTRGSTVGWTDSDGFTSLRIAANTSDISAFGEYQAIAIDDVRVGARGVVPTPEPTSLGLTALALAGAAGRRRRSFGGAA